MNTNQFEVCIFGSSGMIGQSVLNQCLDDQKISKITLFLRHSIPNTHPKIVQILIKDFSSDEFKTVQFNHFKICFFCIGTSGVFAKNRDFIWINQKLPLQIANMICKMSAAKELTFIYVTGTGIEPLAKKGIFWAKTKLITENLLLKLPFEKVLIYRPSIILPSHNERSKTFIYRLSYILLSPFHKILKKYFKSEVTTTELLAKHMISSALSETTNRVFEKEDLNR